MSTPRRSLTITAVMSAAVLAIGLGWFATRPAYPFMPHGHCYLWQPGLLWTHVICDLLIGTAYVAISTTLVILVARARRTLPLHWMFIAFGAFIVACGSTHFAEAWTVWHPDYWLAAFVKIVTAVASVATALILPKRIPDVLALLEAAATQRRQREALEIEVRQRLAAEADLMKLKESLEQRVRDRTSELSQANSALTLYETIFKASAWGVAIVDSVRGLIQLANPAFARMHGYEPDDMVGMPIATTFAPESAAKLPQVVDIINAQDHLMYESIHMRKDQSRFACLTDVTLVRDPQGLPLYRFGYFQDISSQKRAEEDIRNVVTRARCVLWRAAIAGSDGWDKGAAEMSNFSWDFKVQDEVAAQGLLPLNIPQRGNYSEAWLAARHPDDIQRVEKVALRALIDGSHSYSQVYRVMDRTHGTIWIREEVAIVAIGPGRWQCTGVCMDVSAEHRLNEQLRQQAELIELSHDAIVVRGEDGRILFWNSGAEDLYGWRRDEVAGRQAHEILAPGSEPREMSEALAAHGHWAGKARRRTKDGRQIVVETRHLSVNRSDGTRVILETSHALADRYSEAVA